MQSVAAQTTQKLAFLLEGDNSSDPDSIRVLVMSVGGTWQHRLHTSRNADGTYSLELKLPEAGAYWLTMEMPGEAMSHLRFPRLTIFATQADTQ